MTHDPAHYRFSRQRMVQEPLSGTVPPLRPLWHDIASATVIIVLLALLAWWH